MKMALPLRTARQKTLVINNVVAACSDPEKLSNTGYKFLHLCSGFIAHYNMYGFRAFYSQPGHLKHDILTNQRYNQWQNFSPGDNNYEYYMEKKEIYNAIVDRLNGGE